MEIESHGSQQGSRLAQGACRAAKCRCPKGKAGSPSPGVKGLFGTGSITWCGEVADGAEAASWTPARVWLRCCGDRDGAGGLNFSLPSDAAQPESVIDAVCGDVRALPIWVVALVHCLEGVDLLGANVWVSSCGAAAKGWFSYAEAAPIAGWTAALLLRRLSLKSGSSGNAAGALFFTPALGLHILNR